MGLGHDDRNGAWRARTHPGRAQAPRTRSGSRALIERLSRGGYERSSSIPGRSGFACVGGCPSSRATSSPDPEGFQNLGSRSCCGSVVLVYEAAELVAALDLAGGWWIGRVDPLGWLERESSVGTLAVVMHGVGA